MSRNAEIAALLAEFADLLEAKDVEYKPRAYRRAAENIYDHPVAIEDLAADGTDAVMAIEGVGEAIASKVVEYLDTGEIEELEDLREELPVEMEELTRVEGVGPKTVGALYEGLGVTNLEELAEAAREGRIRELAGFGAKTEQNILDNVPFARRAGERSLLGTARPLADDVLAFLEDHPSVVEREVAGSIRRWCETIGDVDVLVASEALASVWDAIEGWDRVESVIEAGEDKASVRIGGIRVDFRFVAPDEFGSALQYFTGSKAHNVRLRNRAIRMGLKMNEYGVFDVSDVDDPDDQRAGRRIAGETERSMYEALGLPWMAPELREDTGEIDAAEAGTLPTPVELGDVVGDLHVHSDWSDGSLPIEAIVDGAAAFGHEYICLSDHAVGPGVVGGVGLSDEELREQIAVIERIDESVAIEVFAGVEANIDAEGGITVADDVLSDLDLVIASPHSQLDMEAPDATERLVAAVEHPSVDVLGHPSGRLLNRRPGMDFDVEAVATAAAASGTALEVNSNPARLDLWGRAVQLALERDATIAINTDAHGTEEFHLLRYGVHTARRGWAEAADVLNARSAADVRKFCH